MEKEKLNKLVCDVSDVIPTLKLVQNYLSCLSVNVQEATTNDEDRIKLLISLVHEKGLNNVYDALDRVVRVLDISSAEIMELFEEEEKHI